MAGGVNIRSETRRAGISEKANVNDWSCCRDNDGGLYAPSFIYKLLLGLVSGIEIELQSRFLILLPRYIYCC